MFININIITNHLNELEQLGDFFHKNTHNHMIFFYDLIKQCDFTNDIFNIYDKIICDDIFTITNKSNSFINYLISNIDTKIIPTNEYENKINLGNIFLTRQLENFYLEQINVTIGDNYWFKNIDKKIINESILEFENSIYKIVINNYTIFKNQNDYKTITYPNVPDLAEPENFLGNWNFAIKLKNHIEDILIFLLFKYSKSWTTIFCTIIIMVCVNVLVKNYFIKLIDIHHPDAPIDSKVLFNWKKFKIFKELKKHWVEIKNEAINVMNTTSKLNLAVEDWHLMSNISSTKSIYNQTGWIKYWKYNPDETLEDKAKNTQTGNPEWLNFGFYHFGNEFIENLKLCPKTANILNKFKSQINICGFSWMMGGCLLYPHTDFSGLNSGTLALHLGLVVPKPENTCKLIIKNDLGQYTQITELEGKIFVFDATYEHYAYNQSNQPRIILYIDFNVDL